MSIVSDHALSMKKVYKVIEIIERIGNLKVLGKR